MKKVAKKKITEPPFILKEVKLISLDKLKLWQDNPRKNDEGVPKLMKLLKTHGIRSPIVVWKNDMTIYKGNTTYKAAKKLGWKHLPVALVDFKSKAAAAAYGIADNKSSEFSEWDDELLIEMLSSEMMEKFHGITGFEETELNGLLMHPDLSKLTKIKEETSGLKAIMKIMCKPEKKKEVVEFLTLVLKRKYGEEVILRS